MTNYTRLLFLALIVFVAVQQVSATESIGSEFRLNSKIDNGGRYMQLRLLGTLKLDKVSSSNESISELSGLAWDEDEQILYAISDQGYLVFLKPIIKCGILVDVLFTKKLPLLDKSGDPLSGGNTDSEGVFALNTGNKIKGDTVLLISFERKPRVVKYKTDGTYISKLPLPDRLSNKSNYQHKNNMLEAVTVHPRHGMVTTSEKPLKDSRQDHFELFDSHGTIGEYAAYDPDASAITAIEYIKDNEFLILERIYRRLFNTSYIVLRKWNSDAPAQPQMLAKFTQEEGFRIDNFEGLTYHQNHRYFMISDDNENFLQKTLLVYFEIIEKGNK